MLLNKCIPCLKSKKVEDITILDFSNTPLTEIFPNVWRYERTLEELYLTSTRIDTLPPQLFYCQNLHLLIANSNNLELIPNAIGSLRQLHHLNISRNCISNVPDSIKLCKNLTYLDLSCNNIQRLPDALTCLISLQELFLNETYLEFLPANFGRLVNLRILELRLNNLISLPKSMVRLCNLRRIDIGANEFIELPDVIGELNKLHELWIDFNQIRHISTNVTKLSELQHFEADGNLLEILPNEMSNWKNLEVLSLCTNNLKSLPSYIGVLRNIITLKCESCNLCELPSSIANLENLEELVVSYNQLQGLPNTIGMLRKLRFLFVDGNNLISLPNEICSCSSLSVLSVRRNRLTELPPQIGHLIQLKVLNLVHNYIEYLPVSILSLVNLTSMWISDNQSQPLVPLQYVDIHTKLHLTCFMLPQTGITNVGTNTKRKENEKMLQNDDNLDVLSKNYCTRRKTIQSPQTYTYVETNSPNRHICFAEQATIFSPHSPVQDININEVAMNSCLSNVVSYSTVEHKQLLGVRLMRSPTPYPKELLLMAKYIRSGQKLSSQNQQKRLSDNTSTKLQTTTINLNNAKDAYNLTNTSIKAVYAINYTNCDINNSFNNNIIVPTTSTIKQLSANMISGTNKYSTDNKQHNQNKTISNQFVNENIYAGNNAQHQQNGQQNLCVQINPNNPLCNIPYYMRFSNAKRHERHQLVKTTTSINTLNCESDRQKYLQSPFNKDFYTVPVSKTILLHNEKKELNELLPCHITKDSASEPGKFLSNYESAFLDNQNQIKLQLPDSEKYLKIPENNDSTTVNDLNCYSEDGLDRNIKTPAGLGYRRNVFIKLNNFKQNKQNLNEQNQQEHKHNINNSIPNLSICIANDNYLAKKNNVLYMKYNNMYELNISLPVKSHLKRTPWLFGVHKNPTVKQITLKWDEQIGFNINKLPNNEGIYIALIVPQTPAARLLRVHDKLLEIDGYDFTTIMLSEANDILLQAGPVVQIMLSRK